MEAFADKQEKDSYLGLVHSCCFSTSRESLFVRGWMARSFIWTGKLRYAVPSKTMQSVDYYRLVSKTTFSLPHQALSPSPTDGRNLCRQLVGLKVLTRTRLIDETGQEEEVVETDTDLGAIRHSVTVRAPAYSSIFPITPRSWGYPVVLSAGENATYHTRSAEEPSTIQDPGCIRNSELTHHPAADTGGVTLQLSVP